MNTPPPVNVNNPALLALLRKSKEVMKKVENKNFTTGHVDARALNEDGVQLMQEEGIRPSATQVSDYTEEQVQNSKLPDIIKKAMLENRIPRASMANNSFSLEDVSELVEKPMGFPKTPKTIVSENRGVINNTNNNDMLNISKSELKEMINESLISFLTNSYNKTLTEETIKKTINMLIKEGKIAVKKK